MRGSQMSYACSTIRFTHGRPFVVHPDGTGLRQVRVHPGGRYVAFEPDWSPDGTRIAFSMYVVRNGQDDHLHGDPDGTDFIQVTETLGHPTRPRRPLLHPGDIARNRHAERPASRAPVTDAPGLSVYDERDA